MKNKAVPRAKKTAKTLRSMPKVKPADSAPPRPSAAPTTAARVDVVIADLSRDPRR